MASDDDSRHDPLGDVINLFAAPIASGVRSFEQLRRGVEELFRTIENLNSTMENLNEAAARVNRLMGDIEEPIRAMIPQLTRTVRTADDVLNVVSGPAKKVAPNLERISETLTSPAFTSLPTQLGEFMTVMGDVSKRLGPLTQFAESAGGLFGLRFPGMGAPKESSSDVPATPPATPSKQPVTNKSSTAKKSPAKKAPAKKAAAKKAAPKRSTAPKPR